MDCRKVRSLIHLYMDNQLEPEQLEPFIRHINSCPDCYEELEINYIMLEGMRRLEQGDQIAVNFQKELTIKLKKQLSRIVRQKRTRFQLVVIGICISLFGILLGYFEQEDYSQRFMANQIEERGPQYFYNQTKYYIFEAGSYEPPSLREIINHGK